jgi:hypothetical protein
LLPLEIIMAKLACFNLVDQLIITATKNSVDLAWIGSVGSFYHQSLVNSATEIYVCWWYKQEIRMMSEWTRQKAAERKIKMLLHALFNQIYLYQTVDINWYSLRSYIFLCEGCKYIIFNIWKLCISRVCCEIGWETSHAYETACKEFWIYEGDWEH